MQPTAVDVAKGSADDVKLATGGATLTVKKEITKNQNHLFVRFLISAKDKQFAIQSCAETEKSAIRFSNPEGEQKYPIKISQPSAAAMIHKLMGWKEGESWNVPGVFLADEKGMLFDLNAAYAPSPKGGWAVRRAKEAAEANMNITSAEETAE